MNARDFLRAVAAVMAGPASTTRASQMAQLAPRLQADFRADQLTAEVADAVAAALRGVPTYPDLAQAVRNAAGTSARPVPQTEDEAWADRWERYVRGRLAEGGNEPHLRSLLRTYCPPSQRDVVMGRLFPHEHAEERAMERERMASKAAAVARAVAQHRTIPQVPRSAIVQPPAPPPKRPEPKPVSGGLIEEARAILRAKAGVA